VNALTDRLMALWARTGHQDANDAQYVHTLPALTSFDGEGLFGYTFGPLTQNDPDFIILKCYAIQIFLNV
jgi:hypothetical protein